MTISTDKLKRNPTIDIMRGFAICLMVLGHTDVPYVKFIYLFHMPFFFFISGWLFNSNDVTAFDNLKQYILKKIKTLWLPFFIFNGILTVLNNVFVGLDIYTMNPMFTDLVTGENNRLIRKMSFAKTGIQLIKNFFFGGESQLGGASWFLRALFIIVVLNAILTFLLCKASIRLKRTGYCFCVCMIMLFTQFTVSGGGYFALPGVFEGIPACSMAFVVGRLSRKIFKYIRPFTEQRNVNIFWFLLSLLVLCLFCHFHSINIGSGRIVNIFFFTASLLAGTIFLYELAFFIKKIKIGYLAKFLQKCSLASIYIIFFHFLSFKIITYLIISIDRLPVILLASFPVIDNPKGWSYAYFLVGVAVPLFVCYVAKQFIKKLNELFYGKIKRKQTV